MRGRLIPRFEKKIPATRARIWAEESAVQPERPRLALSPNSVHNLSCLDNKALNQSAHTLMVYP